MRGQRAQPSTSTAGTSSTTSPQAQDSSPRSTHASRPSSARPIEGNRRGSQVNALSRIYEYPLGQANCAPSALLPSHHHPHLAMGTHSDQAYSSELGADGLMSSERRDDTNSPPTSESMSAAENEASWTDSSLIFSAGSLHTSKLRFPPLSAPRNQAKTAGDRELGQSLPRLQRQTSRAGEHSTAAQLTPEARVRHVLNAVEDMGFDSFDSFATSYYTSNFSEGSSVRLAQAASRTHRLRNLLSSLHECSKTWVGREAQGYQDVGLVSTEQHLIQELAEVLQHQDLNSSKADAKKRAFIAESISQLLRDETTDTLCRQDKRSITERVSNFQSVLCSRVPIWIMKCRLMVQK